MIAAATRAELAAVQQDRSAVGLVAIALAQRIDAFGMVESGSGLAALADKHAAALTRALDPSKVKREAVEGELAKLIGEAGGGLVAIKGGRS